MARRTRKPPVALAAGAAAIIVAGAFLAGTVFFKSDSTPYRTYPPLETSAYLENSKSLRGNTYRLDGEVANSLAWSPSSGRLISVSAGEDILPVLVPTEFNNINIQKGQKFVFLVEVDDRGVLKVKALTKA